MQEREDRTNVEKEACHLNSYPESSLLEDTDQQQPGRHIGILLSEAAKACTVITLNIGTPYITADKALF